MAFRCNQMLSDVIRHYQLDDGQAKIYPDVIKRFFGFDGSVLARGLTCYRQEGLRIRVTPVVVYRRPIVKQGILYESIITQSVESHMNDNGKGGTVPLYRQPL